MIPSKKIRLVSLNGDVNEIVDQFSRLIEKYQLSFNMACIYQKGIDKIPANTDEADYYPLKLYAKYATTGETYNVTIWISEVRCGCGNGQGTGSSDCLIAILEKAKFNVTESNKQAIRNNKSLNLTLYDGTVMKCYSE